MCCQTRIKDRAFAVVSTAAERYDDLKQTCQFTDR